MSGTRLRLLFLSLGFYAAAVNAKKTLCPPGLPLCREEAKAEAAARAQQKRLEATAAREAAAAAKIRRMHKLIDSNVLVSETHYSEGNWKKFIVLSKK